MALYVVLGVLIALLVAVTCTAVALGLLGELGLVRLVRCRECAHFVVSTPDSQPATCPYCRHTHLAHPLRTMRHPLRELAHR